MSVLLMTGINPIQNLHQDSDLPAFRAKMRLLDLPVVTFTSGDGRDTNRIDSKQGSDFFIAQIPPKYCVGTSGAQLMPKGRMGLHGNH